MQNKGKYYITTAIAYTSGKPHIGNTYEIVLADSIARFKRMQGYDVCFQTGTDEHGEKIQLKAEDAGITPQAYVDNIAGEIKRIWDLMNTTYDRFIRTTDPSHEKKIQQIFKKLYDQGDIYKSEYEGMYCTPCESFFTESQLVDGKCPDCGRECHPAKEEAYFFKLSKYAKKLEEHIESHPEFIWPPARKNEMINNFIKPGLQDLCVSRTSFNWGIPVDFDPGHVVYVWIDALSNYITFAGYDPEGNHTEGYKHYWPADLHLIGKDIVRFHTIYWPCILMALGEPLPKQVFGHPWLIMSDGKMSKSKGNVLYADELVELFGVDAVRYFVLHEIPYANDGVISYELMMERINADLANILGNLVNRTVSMTNKYFDGEIHTPGAENDIDRDLKAVAAQAPALVEKHMEGLHIADAIDDIFTLLRRANKYVDETEPWILGKPDGDHDRLATVLYNLLECIRIGATLLKPFMPETAEKIFAQINVGDQTLEDAKTFGKLVAGNKVGKPEILFARIDIPKMTEELNAKKEAAAKAAEKAAKKEEKKPEGVAIIGIEDFAKVALRVAEIKTCEPLPKSDKLLMMTVDNGKGTKQVLSGIAQYYKPEELIGKKVILVDNLAPAKLRGTLSEGMLLAADAPNGVKVIFLDNDLPAGAVIR
ncbi:MAG: methionine--tRNA ligase [Clostridia bacterium]|nr:methionine--tRNA ligase [Clostridia bacterium]